MDKINHCINHNRFIPIDTEELSALELIGKTVEKTNEVVEKSNNHEDRISENERKKVSFDDMKEKFKFDNNFSDIDYRGKWFGLDEPTLSDEGMRSQVEKNRDDIFKTTEQLDSMVKKSFISKNKCLMYAHRGVGQCPENTLIAIEMAGLQGYDGVELDLSVTSDNEIVLMHDPNVDRMTNGTGLVSSMTLAQIRGLTIDGGTKISYYPNMKVPTLDETLQTLIKYNLNGMLELKNMTKESIEKTINTIVEYGLEDKIIFNGQVWDLDIARAYNKNITVAPFGGELTETLLNNAKKYLPNVILGLNHTTLTKGHIDLCHKNGVRVDAWSPTDNADKDRLVSIGVDLIVGGVK